MRSDMKCAATLGLMWLVSCQAALGCESLAGNTDPGELEGKAPIAGDGPRSIVHIQRNMLRGNRMFVVIQRGIEFASPSGTPAVAVHGGRVVSAQTYGEYGKAVIVDHGGGVRTLYGRLESFDVREGGCVAAGAVIGRVGSPPGGGNPTLFFEISTDGQFIWPTPQARSIGFKQ